MDIFDILPCPFCGGEAMLGKDSELRDMVYCLECGAKTWGFDSDKQAILRWNTRVNDRKNDPLLFIEDGSIDIDDLKGVPVTPVIYRRGSNVPKIEWLGKE